MSLKVAKVVIDNRTRQVDKAFTYRIPEALRDTVMVGVRVRVPFGAGNRHVIGFVTKVEECPEHSDMKDIAEVLDETPIFDREKLLEAYWIKNRYFSTFGDAIKLFLPPGHAARLTEWVRLENRDVPMDNMEKKIADILTEQGEICAFDVLREACGDKTRKTINRLMEKGAVTVSHTTEKGVGVKRMRVLRFAKSPTKKLSEAGTRALRVMQECDVLSMADLCLFASCSSSTVHTLIKNGVLEAEEIEVLRTPEILASAQKKEIVLNEEQTAVVNGINTHPVVPFVPMLLRGVTGSGKTEVYLAAIDKVLKEGKSAIVLVPEIALTHQMVSRFLSRFGKTTAVLHSGLSVGERHDEWLRIFRGEARVAVGARSAIFAPCKNLGLIVLDEEHEDTYKSENGVPYHAREVAMCRAHTEGAKVLLASATPSVESYYQAKNGKYKLFEMLKRFNDFPLPKTSIIDMREEMHRGNTSPISIPLREEIEKNLKNEEQTILFLNRRGHSTFVSCRQCGYVETCPNCSISLTYHSFSDTLNCHYCGYRKKSTNKCPSCNGEHMRGFGTGTQKIETVAEETFENASVIRMDMDTTRKKENHEKLLSRFRDENIDILLGTQMIAKGLDFPNVTLVGVLNADQLLNMGDFRAAERTFDLITQVSGRGGRGDKEGRTIIQTHTPDSPVILAAAKHDYLSFYEEEIFMRKALNYPPFCDIINITVTGKAENEVKMCANRLYSLCEKTFRKDIQLFRAAPCGVNKIKNTFRWHLWMKCRLDKEKTQTLRKIIATEKKLSVFLDVNPSSI